MNFNDFRKAARISVSYPVAICFTDGSDTESWGRLCDISYSGGRLETRKALRSRQKVRLSIALSEDNILMDISAEVVRVLWDEGYYIVALSFENSEDRDHLKKVLSEIVKE